MKGPSLLSLVAVLGWLWLLPVCYSLARETGVPQPPQAALRVTTRLVVVNAVVHDKKGAPVAGLTRDDFTILDGGEEEKISIFSVARRGDMNGSFEPLSPNVFSNRMARPGGIPFNVVVILLDRSGTAFEDSVYAREQLIKFLNQLQPRDRIALYVYRGRLRVIQDSTDDPSPLIEALRQYGGSGQPHEMPEASFRGLSGISTQASNRLFAGLSDFLNNRSEDYRISLSLDTLEALTNIANHLSGLPGRKSIVWLTGSVPFAAWNPDPRL